jgi:hypothetical protein
MQQGTLVDIDRAHESEKVLLGGSFAETIAGAGAVILSVVALVGILSDALLAVSVVALGAAFVLESISISTRFDWVMRHAAHNSFEMGAISVGMTTKFMAGAAGIGLGVLSLLRLVPDILLPIAAIVYGITLLSGVGVQTRLNDLEMQCSHTHEMTGRISHEAVSAASGIQILFGVGAATLGILALAAVAAPVTLTLVGVLAVGGASLFSGAAISARIWGFDRYCELAPQRVNR